MGTPYFSVASIFIQVRKNVFQILCQNLSSTLHCLGQASTNLSTAGICVSDPKRWWIIRDELFLEGNSSIINDISGGESRAFGSKSRSGKSTSKSSAFNDTFDLAFFQLNEVFTCLACRDLRATAISPRLQAKRARWWPPLTKGSEPSTRGRGEPGKGDKELGSGTDRAMANGSLKGWCGILVIFGGPEVLWEKTQIFLAPAVALKGRYSNGFLLEQVEMKAKMGSHARKHTLKNGIRNFFGAFLLARAVQNDKCCILGLAWSLTAIWPRSHDGQDHRWCLAIFCPPMQQHVGSFVTPYLSFNVFYECTCASIFIRLFACYLSIIYLFLSTSISKEYWYIIPLTYSAYMSCDSRSFICSSSNPDCNILYNPQISTQFLLG